MWIRNQEKTVLVDSKMFKVEENAVFMLTDDYTEEGWYLAGEYETKKRALEVLDIISEKIKTNCEGIINNQFDIQVKGYTVFQMPEE